MSEQWQQKFNDEKGCVTERLRRESQTWVQVLAPFPGAQFHLLQCCRQLWPAPTFSRSSCNSFIPWKLLAELRSVMAFPGLSSSLCNSFIITQSPAWNLQDPWFIHHYYYSYHYCWNDSLLVLETGSCLTHHNIPGAKYGDLQRWQCTFVLLPPSLPRAWIQLKINLTEPEKHLPSQYRAPNSY